MLNITFVYPDFENLGVEYLMSLCKEQGHNVNLVFYCAEDPYTGIKSKSLDYKAIAKRIVETKPDVAIFSCITDNFRHQLNCATELKSINPEIYVIFGGIHVTAVPHKVIRQGAVDAVAIGEGEVSIPTFLAEYERNKTVTLLNSEIDGIVYKKEGFLVGSYLPGKSWDLDKIPFPAKEQFYKAMGYVPKEYYIITSRGCPYKCSYCYNSLDKIPLRRRSVDNVIAELKGAKEKFKIKYVHFCDDSFTTNWDWVKEFSKSYKKEIALPFLCSVNPLLINKEIIGYLKDAGCVDIQIGVQSLSEKLCREVLKRKTDNKKIKEALLLIKEAKMMVQVDQMLGIPGDSLEIQEESLLFYKELKPNLVSVFWLTYYPGTEIVTIAKERGILTDEDVQRIEEGYKLAEGGLHPTLTESIRKQG
ncbi:MAG: radical SAM protein [bacterium]